MDNLISWQSTGNDPGRRKTYTEQVHSLDKNLGAFLQFDPEKGTHLAKEGGHLEGVPCAVKDNIAVKGFKLTCGSNMLKDFISPYTATAVEKLLEQGVLIAGKTNLDEFGMGSSTDTSSLGTTSNPWDISRVAGGSSGGSAAAVAAGLVPFALGTDTGGSIRQPASFCGIYGLKPTYGAVSRYGLVAYASSLEVIGVLSRDVETIRRIFHIIHGVDPMDHSSIEHIPSGEKRDSYRLGIPAPGDQLDPEVESVYTDVIEAYRDRGFDTKIIEIPSLEYVVPAYYTIATAEASANLARFNGIRYGYRPEWAENPEELMRKARDEGFGDEVKLRILLGTYVLRSGFQDQYYIRAQKIRTAIRNDLDRVFQEVDMLLSPVFPTPPFPHGEAGLSPFQQKMADRFTATANLAGIPALTVPGKLSRGLPIGVQLMAPPFEEERLFHAAEIMAGVLPIQKPPLFLDME